MKYIKQFAIVIAVSFTAEIINYVVPLPIPASIWGLTLMLVLLMTKIVKLSDVKECANFLVSLMQIMFIPAAVGLITAVDSLKSSAVAIIISILLVTPIVFFASGKTTQFFISRAEKKNTKGADTDE